MTVTTPSSTVSFSAGTPSWTEASFRSSWRAAAAAWRNCGLLGVARVHLDALKGYIEFFRHHLSQGRLDAGAQFNFTGEYGDGSVRGDGQPRIERGCFGLSGWQRLRWCAERSRSRPQEGEVDDQPAGILQKLATRQQFEWHRP